MSLLKDLSAKYPDILPAGITLEEAAKVYLKLFDGKATMYLSGNTLIALQELEKPNTARAWLLFEHFTKGTVSAMKALIKECRKNSVTVYTTTEDIRIKNILIKLDFIQEKQVDNEYYLVLEV